MAPGYQTNLQISINQLRRERRGRPNLTAGEISVDLHWEEVKEFLFRKTDRASKILPDWKRFYFSIWHLKCVSHFSLPPPISSCSFLCQSTGVLTIFLRKSVLLHNIFWISHGLDFYIWISTWYTRADKRTECSFSIFFFIISALFRSPPAIQPPGISDSTSCSRLLQQSANSGRHPLGAQPLSIHPVFRAPLKQLPASTFPHGEERSKSSGVQTRKEWL